MVVRYPTMTPGFFLYLYKVSITRHVNRCVCLGTIQYRSLYKSLRKTGYEACLRRRITRLLLLRWYGCPYWLSVVRSRRPKITDDDSTFKLHRMDFTPGLTRGRCLPL